MSVVDLSKRLRLLAPAALTGLALATVTAACSAVAPAPHTTAPHTTAAAPLTGQIAASAAPRYFLDVVHFSGASGGQLQVRHSATGALVQQPGTLALGVAPVPGTSQFVVAEQAGNECASVLYRTTLSAGGRLGPLTSFGKTVPGEVTSVAAAADGRRIAYFAWPCSKSASGYLAELDVRTGHVRRWGDVSIDGSAGDIAPGSGLSLSADGRLVAFAGAAETPDGVITAQRVWLLSTAARPGILAVRSRVVLTRSVHGAALDSVQLSPGGRLFYLCAVSTDGVPGSHRTVTQTAVITARKTATGAIEGTVAKLTATGVTAQGENLGCPLAITPGGRYLLVPYQETYARSTETGPLIRAARIDTATKAAARITFRLPGSAGMSIATGIVAAW